MRLRSSAWSRCGIESYEPGRDFLIACRSVLTMSFQAAAAHLSNPHNPADF